MKCHCGTAVFELVRYDNINLDTCYECVSVSFLGVGCLLLRNLEHVNPS